MIEYNSYPYSIRRYALFSRIRSDLATAGHLAGDGDYSPMAWNDGYHFP